MPVDNALYDAHADTWWDEGGFLHLLRTLVNPARLTLIRDTLKARIDRPPCDVRVLDIGSGGGLLAEEITRLGFRVTGIDPSAPSVGVAIEHARRASLPARYAVALGERLPFSDETFDAAYCCDVLEHVEDYDLVIQEAARVLKTGGLFFYDTINRTRTSKLVIIKLFQQWRWSRVMLPNTHDWTMFITPRELRTNMAWHGFMDQQVTGLRPRRWAPAILWALLQRRRGRISYAELGRRLQLGPSRHVDVMYMGCAVKKPSDFQEGC